MPRADGADLLLLRAAIESLGRSDVTADVQRSCICRLLDHPAATSGRRPPRALGDLCNTQAITTLRVRYQSESTDQVKLAISEALRILGQPFDLTVN